MYIIDSSGASALNLNFHMIHSEIYIESTRLFYFCFDGMTSENLINIDSVIKSGEIGYH